MQNAKERFQKVKKLGVPQGIHTDLYHRLLRTSWWAFTICVFTAFLLINVIFAFLYWIHPQSLSGADGSFFQAFAFSVVTFSTIGYGNLAPQTDWSNSVMIIEAMSSFFLTALLTGMTFAKFSRPSARILFSDKALITSYDGNNCLIFRMGNLRGNEILEATVSVVALVNYQSKEGFVLRRQVDLPLIRNNSLFFALTWVVIHIIDEKSPFFGKTKEDLIRENIEVAVSVTGLDETVSQTIHSNCIYSPEDMFFNRQFEDVLFSHRGKVQHIDYRKFHDLKA